MEMLQKFASQPCYWPGKIKANFPTKIWKRRVLDAMANEVLVEQNNVGKNLKEFSEKIIEKPDKTRWQFELNFNNCILYGEIDAYRIISNGAILVEFEEEERSFDKIKMAVYALALREKYPNLKRFFCYHFYLQEDDCEMFQLTTDSLEFKENELEDLTNVIKNQVLFFENPFELNEVMKKKNSASEYYRTSYSMD